ncbi:MAG TPA: hypothetical protein VIK91_13060 [Nannocystis sp.]
MLPTIYRALPAGLKVNRTPDPIPYAGACLGTVWTQPIRDDLAVLLIADTPEIRQKLASVGILVQERPVKEAAA